MSLLRFNLPPILAIALSIGCWHGLVNNNFKAEAAHNNIFLLDQDENFIAVKILAGVMAPLAH